MGVHLDWKVESEEHGLRATDDAAQMRRAQLHSFFKLFWALFGMLTLCGVIYGGVMWRLHTVENRLKAALHDTVQAEVAALRIGDRAAFLSVQRSASPTWEQTQQAAFDAYQQLKVANNLQLTGEVLNITLDGSRGRVQVQEIIDGAPYVNTWFYWYYSDGDGWRHVPPDYTFWGVEAEYTAPQFSIRYREVDRDFALAMADEMNRWFALGCDLFSCNEEFSILVDVIPVEGLSIQWNEANSWLLQVPSPYVGQPRQDIPYPSDMRRIMAQLVAERMVMQFWGNIQPSYDTDAAYMQDSVTQWLTGRFIQQDRGSYLIDSYVTSYGMEAFSSALHQMLAGGDVSALASVLGQSVDGLSVDWRDYLTWRLELEQVLHERRDQARFVALYDTYLPEVAALAFMQFDTPINMNPLEVISVQREVQSDGVMGLRVVAYDAMNQTEQAVLFRLSDGIWKRVN